MRFAFLAFALFSFLGMGADNLTFDRDIPEEMPPYWTAVQTRSGPRGEWIVRRESGAPSKPNVLSQVSRAGSRFELKLAVFDRMICHDGDLSVKFRIRPGPGPKTAGLIFRYQDPRNYYMLHLSADERNVALFRVDEGKARPLAATGSQTRAFGLDHDIYAGSWYVAKVSFRGQRFRVMLGNRLLFEAQDASLPGAGKTGVWTRGSTVASFDDFRIDKKN